MTIIIVFIGILAWVLWLRKMMVRPHRFAILATAIPPTLLATAAVVLILLDPALVEAEGRNIADICWLVGFYLVVQRFYHQLFLLLCVNGK